MRDAVGGDEIGVAESWEFVPAVNRSKTKFNGRMVGAKIIYLTGVASDSTGDEQRAGDVRTKSV